MSEQTNQQTLVLLPGETADQAMLRRVKMHEFLMTGGVQTGHDKLGKMVYSDPITAAEHPVCPWHGDGCLAWEEIVAGRGYWTAMEAELDALREELPEAESSEEFFRMESRMVEIEEKLEFRPRDALTLRSRTPEQVEQERAKAKAKKAPFRFPDGDTVAAKIERNRKPWDRAIDFDENGDRIDNRVFKDLPNDTFKPMWSEPEDDSRDDAVAAFMGEAIPDEIVIDGDEEDED